MFTQRWQDHQRALDVQTALVSDMTAAATSYALDINYDHIKLSSYRTEAERRAWSEKLESTYRRWQLKRNVIRSRLLAYYGEGSVLASWDRLSVLLQLVWGSAAKFGNNPFGSDERRRFVAIVGKRLPTGQYDDAWDEAMIAVDTLRDKAVVRVLDATPSV
jgi:hypothetical protein